MQKSHPTTIHLKDLDQHKSESDVPAQTEPDLREQLLSQTQRAFHMSSSWCWSIFKQSSLSILCRLNVNSQMMRRIIFGLSFERFSGVMAWNNSRVLYNIYAYTHVYTWVHQINSETSCSSYLIFLLSHKLFSLIYLRIILDTFANLKIASKFFSQNVPKRVYIWEKMWYNIIKIKYCRVAKWLRHWTLTPSHICSNCISAAIVQTVRVRPLIRRNANYNGYGHVL